MDLLLALQSVSQTFAHVNRVVWHGISVNYNEIMINSSH